MDKLIKKYFLCFSFVILLLCILSVIGLSAYAGEKELSEYQVKAAFIYNFARFIEWPDNNTTITLCIIGDNPFGRDIDTIQGKPVKDKVLLVKHIRSVHEAKNCQILFISISEKKDIMQILKELKGYSILTIGDTEGAAQQGVIINFYIEDDKVRFEINIEAAKRARIQISSKLLKLARIVEE